MWNGILNLYKPRGFTSQDAVSKARGIFGQKKAGHTGTLDPEAEGVLPICLGKATKACGLLTDWTKTYETAMHLGIVTDTQDMTGTVLQASPVTVSEQEIREIAASFVGEIKQVPPMYSAKKIGGKKLYELARKGKTVERQPRDITIYSLDVLEVDFPIVRMRITCSKGTYIRTICHDIGRKAGCGAAMESLLRTRVGMFSVSDAITFDKLQEAKDEGRLSGCLSPVDSIFENLPKASFCKESEKAARNGNPLPFSSIPDINLSWLPAGEDQIRLYGPDGSFYGIYQADRRRNMARPVQIFKDLA